MFEKFKLFRKFRFKKWQKISPDKRFEYAQKFENYFAKIQHREPKVVGWKESLGDANGVCEFNGKHIYVVADLLRDSAKMFTLMRVLLHEGRHAYQYYYVNVKYASQGRVSKFSKAYKWKMAMGGYIDAENSGDFTDYANQSIELDANMYALKQLKKMKRRYSKNEEYFKEVKHLEDYFEYVDALGREKYGRFYKFKIGRKNKKQYKKNRKNS